MIGLDDLEGTWRLSREIEDRRLGCAGRLDGEATWTAVPDGLVQEERGRLRFGDGPEMAAHRRYLWSAEGQTLHVRFEDGRAFHRLGPDHLSDIHLCPPDIYEVDYRFEGRGVFATTWHVRGPRKNLVIRSRFRKSAT